MTRKTLFVGFAFDCSAHPPLYCHQQIDATAEGIEHFIDGKLRAQVTAEHSPEYLRAGWVGDIGRADPQWADLANIRRMNVQLVGVVQNRRENDANENQSLNTLHRKAVMKNATRKS